MPSAPQFDIWAGAAGLNRRAFTFTAFADQRVKDMFPWLMARKAVMEGGLELPERVHAALHIAGYHVTGGYGPSAAFGSTGW